MLAMAAFTPLLPGYEPGDHWTIQRTIRFVQPTDHVDVTTTERLVYKVIVVEAERTVMSVQFKPDPNNSSKGWTRTMNFHPNGTLIGPEPDNDPNIARLNRMEWTALEPREGISWARRWPASTTLLEGNVTVKPTSKTPNDFSYLVTYKEAPDVKCVATIKVLAEERIIEDVAFSVSTTTRTSKHPGTLVITERLKDIVLSDR